MLAIVLVCPQNEKFSGKLRHGCYVVKWRQKKKEIGSERSIIQDKNTWTHNGREEKRTVKEMDKSETEI